jgi:DNA mismatch repair protein MutS
MKEETSAPNLKIRWNSVFGYYIEVTKSQLAKVPPAWRRKQTVAGGERYTNDELDQLAADIESAEDRALEREMNVFAELVELVGRAADRVRRLAETLAAWDVAAGLAEVAHARDYARPEVDLGDVIDIAEGRHPVVEVHAAKGRFVPNDTTLDLGGTSLWLVTGPNMAGKSTLMRQVALIVILAQTGSFVPAKRARVGIVDRLLSRVGASDAVARGDSTFMVEMRETASILRHATRRSLVILDEIGRGTSTYDGLAIAWAVAEHLAEITRCRALFATHYHELTELSKTSPAVDNVSVAAREHAGSVVFLHSLVKGPASRSYGIAVARLAGVPESVSARAEAILSSLEGDGASSSGEGPKKKRGRGPQLDLFGAGDVAMGAGEKQTLATLRALEIERMTPLEALTLLATLKRQLQ